MATIIQVKRTTTANLPSTLEQGELAYLYDTSATDTDAGGNGGRLYIGDPTSNTNTPLKIGGKYYTDLLDHAHGTVTASAGVIVDSNKKVDEWNVDNLKLNGNALTSTDTNGNISITPNGTGKTVISNVYIGDTSTTLEEYIEDVSGGQIQAGEGIDVVYDDGAGTTTISGEDASDANKGIAIFSDTSDFSVSSGDVSLADTVVKTVTTDSGALTPSSHGFSVLGGEGMDVTHTGTTITVAGEDATSSNKGVASFDATDFTVTSGAVAVNTITLGSSSLNPGETTTDIAGITSLDVDNINVNGNTVSTTDANGDLTLSPNGTGTVVVPSGYEGRAGFTADSLVNKTYVDQVANGLDVKASVRVATTANLSATYNNSNGTLTASSNGAISIDGVTLSVGDRVLVKDQTSQVQNGIYKVTTTGGASAAFVLTRTPDADEASEVTGGAFTFVEEGTANADNGYVATHNGTPTLGTTNITFDQFSGAGQISAGDGLSKTGNTIDVNVDDSSIEIAADTLQVKALGITNAMLAGSIANAKLTNSTITMAADSGSNAVDLGDTFTLTGGTGIDTAVSGDTVTITLNQEQVEDYVSGLLVAGEGIDLTYDDGAGTLTVDAEIATSSNRGVASFSTDNFLVTSGAVTITGIDGGTY